MVAGPSGCNVICSIEAPETARPLSEGATEERHNPGDDPTGEKGNDPSERGDDARAERKRPAVFQCVTAVDAQ